MDPLAECFLAAADGAATNPAPVRRGAVYSPFSVTVVVGSMN